MPKTTVSSLPHQLSPTPATGRVPGTLTLTRSCLSKTWKFGFWRTMPESTMRATLNQELIRQMVNTSEMVSNDKRVEIVYKNAKKLMSSEYPLDQTRNIIVCGLKVSNGLVSLSKVVTNPKWKPYCCRLKCQKQENS